MKASSEGIFISPLLGTALFSLYQLAPSVSWFSLLLYLGLSTACFFSCLIILASVNTFSVRAAGLLGVFFFIFLTATQISFTAVSMMLWLTACVFLMRLALKAELTGLCYWLASINLAVAFLLRPSLLPLFMIFAAPLISALFLGGNPLRAVRTFLPLIVVVLLGLMVGATTRASTEYADYERFNEVRSEFIDTYRSHPTANTDQALVAAGWSTDDYNVLKNWWLHDGSFFNTEQTSTFLKMNDSEYSIFHLDELKINLNRDKLNFQITSFWVFLVAVSGAVISKQRNKLIILIGYLFLIGTVVLIMGVRFPERIAYPCSLLLFLYPTLLSDKFSQNGRLAKLKPILSITLIIFLTASNIAIVETNIASTRSLKKVKAYIDQSTSIILQQNGHDSVIVEVNPHVLPTNYFPFQENDAVLKTRTMMGGWLVGSPAYLDFLAREGLGDRASVVSSMIDNPKIVLRFWDSPYLSFKDYSEVFLRHFRQRYATPNNNRTIEAKIIHDFHQKEMRLVYFQIITLAKKAKPVD